jgi:hypothetical protein
VHAKGDEDMIDSEASKGENKANLTSFIASFLILSVLSLFCCYLNYTFDSNLSKHVFLMFVTAWILDQLLFRMLYIIILTLLKLCQGKRKGYKPIKTKTRRELSYIMNRANKKMFTHHKNEA